MAFRWKRDVARRCGKNAAVTARADGGGDDSHVPQTGFDSRSATGQCNRRNFDMTKDERANLIHALQHLEANEIADDTYRSYGWYRGDKGKFVKRHIKAIAFLRTLLKDSCIILRRQ